MDVLLPMLALVTMGLALGFALVSTRRKHKTGTATKNASRVRDGPGRQPF